MKMEEIYRLFIKLGMENDPREQAEIARVLERTQKEFTEMKNEDKADFDSERLKNPYSDTRILVGDPDTEIMSILAGIDMELQEILLADRLREKGNRIDLVLAHHPEGTALAALDKVMHVQEDIMAQMGVPINVAEGILTSRIQEVERALMPVNHNRAVDAAKLLGFSFMCVHTPADNMVNRFLENVFAAKKPDTVGDVVKTLKEIPEYKEYVKTGAGPKIVLGSEEKRAGKLMLDMTGGTSGSEDAYAKLSAAGVGTIICMHIGEKHRKEAEKNHINVVVAGHMASDSLAMNLLLDALEQKGVKVMTCSGLVRIKRF